MKVWPLTDVSAHPCVKMQLQTQAHHRAGPARADIDGMPILYNRWRCTIATMACSQALLPCFLPEQISLYRAQHSGVTFSINVRDRQQAERDLSNF